MNILEMQKKYSAIPAFDLDLLIACAIKKPKEFIFTHPEYELSTTKKIRLHYSTFLYKKGFSVAAITKHKEFYGLDFFVNNHVLIPRPDTELMVGEATKIMNYELRIKNTNILYIDVGTGSGCIPIAIIKRLKHKNIKTTAIDISSAALRVAKKNAKKHKVKIKFLHGNLLKPILKSYKLQADKLIITANLPYLTEQQFQKEPSIQKEPKLALVADKNGLSLYEELLKQITLLISNIKYPIIILLEIDPSQTEEISKLIKQYLPQSKTEIGASPYISGVHSGKKKEFSSHSFSLEIKKDIAGRDRLVKISLK